MARGRSATAAPGERPRILVAGDGALVVEYGSAVDERLSARVMALDAAIAAAGLPGVIETVPTYRSLAVLYDPLVVRAAALVPRLERLAETAVGGATAPRRWTIPVCYGGTFGEDLEFVARAHGMTADQVVATHADATYRVYMIGFTPGFAYLGGLPEVLHTSRREVPRTRVPAGSVAIGGQQASIFSVECPSGWHMLGRTPALIFDLRRERPFLLEPGDLVRFAPVDAAEYATLAARAGAGEAVAACDAAAPAREATP